MAKGKNNSYSGQRDNLNQSLTSLLNGPLIRPPIRLLPLPQNPYPQEVLPYVGDRRFYTPDVTTAPPRSVTRSASKVVAGKQPAALSFSDPKFVGICARRQIRKEVLHALKRTRKGAGSKKHFNFWSKVGCK